MGHEAAAARCGHEDNRSAAGSPSRTRFEVIDIVREVWQHLDLPDEALNALNLPSSSDSGFPSSFKISQTAQASIALSALTASLCDSTRKNDSQKPLRKVTVPLEPACLNFSGARLYTLDGVQGARIGSHVGGLHETSDGYVKIHDGFAHHRDGALRLLGLPMDVTRDQVSERVRLWKKLELEEAAYRHGLVIYALRSYAEWDATLQGTAVRDHPIMLRRIDDSPCLELSHEDGGRCLSGLRVLDLTRVVAGQVAGKTIASHGADVMWITSPDLPDMPSLDRNLSRGKRTVQLDLNLEDDRKTLYSLVKDCDVFLQGYRPGSLATKGFGTHTLARLRPGIIVANLSAFGPDGPWAERRGFDSLVQTASGMNFSEAEHFGAGEPGRACPTQVLDYAAGYFLAAGIAAAVYKRATEGGTWEVHVSLAGAMVYLRSLGQHEGRDGFDAHPQIPRVIGDVPVKYREERQTGYGRLVALKEAPIIDCATPYFEHMPKPPGIDKLEW